MATTPTAAAGPDAGIDPALDEELAVEAALEERHEHPSDGTYIVIALILAVLTSIEIAIYYIKASTAVTITPTAAPGWAFAGWTGGGCTGAGACALPALAAGFLDQLVLPDELVPVARAEAQRLAGIDLAAHAATKLRLREAALTAIRTGIDREFPEAVADAS